jgi:anti-sigma factor RsiW
MQRPSDERLIAYLDGEIAEGERAEIAAWLERDAALRERAARLTESAALLRSAFDDVLHEALPEQLVKAAHGAEGGEMIDLAAARNARQTRRYSTRRWWIGTAAAAAAVVCLALGAGIGYFAGGTAQVAVNPNGSNPEQAADAYFPDNLAGYYKRYVNVAPEDQLPFDKLPQNFQPPNLKPWGLEFQGSRFLMVEGQQATALLYGTSDKTLGPIIVVVANTNKPDSQGGPATRGDINVWRWVHHGHAYAVAGTVNTNYLWNLHNDLSYQFDGI